MVATTMKEVELKVDVKKPEATQAVPFENKDDVDFIYIGFPINATVGTEPRIQLDDRLAPNAQAVAEWKLEKVRERGTVIDIVPSLKVHTDVGMRLVSDVKEELRNINAIKINYSADKVK
tara:strand:- start:1215 stop:1574 length:360 start_codon:yes stop_codon:yes gene_type:complete